MGHNSVTQPLHLIDRHVGIGGKRKVVRLKALIYKAIDCGVHLVAHRLDDNTVNRLMVTLACCLECVQARDVTLMSLLAHGEQLIGETTHCRNHNERGLILGIDDILKVEQTLDRTDRGASKFHNFHCYQYCFFIIEREMT